MNAEDEKRIWRDALDAVLELLRMHPPSRIGEAAFMRRLINLKGQYNANPTNRPDERR